MPCQRLITKNLARCLRMAHSRGHLCLSNKQLKRFLFANGSRNSNTIAISQKASDGTRDKKTVTCNQYDLTTWELIFFFNLLCHASLLFFLGKAPSNHHLHTSTSAWDVKKCVKIEVNDRLSSIHKFKIYENVHSFHFPWVF